MSTPEGGRSVRLRRVEEALESKFSGFGLFQALRLLEQIHEDATPVGGFGDPADEAARISHNPALGFPAREIEELSLEDDGPHRVTSNVFGLLGAMGVMPHPYSILVLERQRDRDPTAREFLDIFNHRMVSLLYAAWRKGKPELSLERDEPDPHLHHLLDLVGVGHEPDEALPGVPRETLGWYAGLLAPPTRSAPALEQLLEDRFGVPVQVEPFVGGWLDLRDADLCRVGEEDEGATLGTGAVVGDEVWDPHARIRIRMGPLTRAAYDRLLPGQDDHETLRRLVRFFSRDQFEVELQLILARDEVPGTVLGGDAPSTPLGWGTWLRSRPRTRDADETILYL